MRDWVADFEAAHEPGITVQAAIEGRDGALASGSRNRTLRRYLLLMTSGFLGFVSARSSVG